MNVRKFITVNAREGLRMVKETLGPDAIILSNRSVVGGVEIMAVAAKDMAMIVPPQARDEPEDDYHVSLSRPAMDSASAAAPRLPEPAPRSAAAAVAPAMPRPAAPQRAVAPAPTQTRQPERQPLATPRKPEPVTPAPAAAPAVATTAVADPAPVAMMDEIRALRRIVEQHLAGFAWGAMTRSEPVKTEVLKHMLDVGFSPRFCRDLLERLPSDMDFKEALAWTKTAADRELFTLGGDNDLIDRGGVFALVGPTGAGKTTTTAKLAARCVLRHGADKVALVTTDGYRIGAHEQLRIYGRILGVPVFVVKDGVDLKHTLRELQRKHMVLIDTMGMSQRDKHVAEQIAMLSGSEVRRLLLMPATSRGDTLDDVIKAYMGGGLAGCVLTKIDEAVSLAPAVDAVIRHRLPLCYVSNGQRVPEDLHLPNRAYLMHRAFKDAPATSPHRYTDAEPALMMASSGFSAAEARRA